MDALIKLITKLPYSGEDILTLCDGKTNILTYKELMNYNNIDEVLSPFGCAVILYETKPNYGHWVCLIKHDDNIISFYDSYGLGVDEQLNFIDENLKYMQFNNEPILSIMLENSNYNIDENKVRLQKYISDNNTCGRYVGFRIVLKDIKNDYFNYLMKSTKMNPDMLVSYLTAFIK